MAYELVAARMMAPTVGSSTYVWTSVIGVIIAALSLGYWLGGRVADTRHRGGDVVRLLFGAAAGVVMTLMISQDVFHWAAVTFGDLRLQAVVVAAVVFAPTSFVLGMISPYLAKLNVRSLETAGKSVANLGALNSIGGIVGTFVTGFFLFGMIGSRETLVLLIVLLIVSAWLLVPRQKVGAKIVVTIILLLMGLLLGHQTQLGRVSIDTPSAHYVALDFSYKDRPLRGLMTGPGGLQSGMYLDGGTELPFWYTQEMMRITRAESPKRVLVLGGGAFTMPQKLATDMPEAIIDVVEIDPELERISKDYFSYKHPRNVNLIFEDARTYVQRTSQKYDVVLVDVYGDAQLPFSIMTAEFGQAVAKIVAHDGVMIANVIAGTRGGPCQDMLASIDAAYRQKLPYAEYSTESGQSLSYGNHILTYRKQPAKTADMQPLEDLGGKLYTDNFIPSEQLYFACQAAAR